MGALPSAEGGNASTCQVTFSDGSAALGTLMVGSGTEGVLETDPYTTAAGTKIPAKTWRLELSLGNEGNRSFRVREKLPSA